VTVVLQESPPLFLFLFGHNPIGADQGFDIFKLGGIKGMDAKFRLREKVVKTEMVFMSVRGNQIVYGSLILKLLQFVPVAGGINDRPVSIVDQHRMAKGIFASPNQPNLPFGKIEHGSILALLRAVDPGNEKE